MSTEAMQSEFARIVRLATAAGLPEVSEGTNYGTPALLVRGKSFVRMKDAGTLVIMCPLEQKELLMQVAPDIYFQTEHYRGWPAVLVRLAAIDDEELRLRLEDAWREKAPKRLAAERAEAAARK